MQDNVPGNAVLAVPSGSRMLSFVAGRPNIPALGKFGGVAQKRYDACHARWQDIDKAISCVINPSVKVINVGVFDPSTIGLRKGLLQLVPCVLVRLDRRMNRIAAGAALNGG